ncbi:hypothetical protein Neosp_015096 [[Neocosmospora] mangrovei]
MPPRPLASAHALHPAETVDLSSRTRQTPVGLIDCVLTDPRGPPSTEKLLTLGAINSSVSHAQTPDDASIHFRHLLGAHNDEERHTILRGIANESPTLARLSRDASKLRPREQIDRDRREQAEKKKQSDAVWLDAEWGGKGWIPLDVRAGLSTVGLDEPSGDVEAGGTLRVAVDREVAKKTGKIKNRQSTHSPHLTGRIAKEVYQSIIDPTTEETERPSEPLHDSISPGSPFTDQWPTNSADDNYVSDDLQPFDPASSPSSLRSDTPFYTPPPYPLDDPMAGANTGENKALRKHLCTVHGEIPASGREKRRRKMHLGENLQAIGQEEIIRACHEARSHLDTALASKAEADLALASLNARVTAIRDVQEVVDKHIRDERRKIIALLGGDSYRDSGISIEGEPPSNGLESALESGATIFLNGAKKSRDLIVELGQGLELEIDEACCRQQKAADGVRAAQENLDTLDRLSRAKEAHDSQVKAKRHLEKMEALVHEAREQFEEADKQHTKSLEMAENGNWMACVDGLRKLGGQEYLEE